MKLRKSILAVTTLASIVSLTSCKKTESGTSLTVCIASEPATLDPALNSAVDGATLLVHLDGGLYRWVKNTSGDGLRLDFDLAESVQKESVEVKSKVFEKENNNWTEVSYPQGKRYTVKLKEGIKWSNGDPITSEDFIWSWNRASSKALAADYGYMFEPICNYEWNAETDEGSLGLAKVDDRTFTIDVPVDLPYFEQLPAFPAFFPVNKKTVEENDKGKEPGTWATEPKTFVSCGAFTLDSWTHKSNLVLKKNPNYWNASKVSLDKITFALSAKDDAVLASFQNDEYDMIDSVPIDQMDDLKENYKDEFFIANQFGTYYVSFNVNSEAFDAKANTEEKRAKVRKALNLLIDREHIVKEISKGGQTPANGFVSGGLSDPEGGEYIDHNGPNSDGKGYFNRGLTDAEYQANVNDGIAILKEVGYSYDESTKKFTDFPTTVTYLYNEASLHKGVAEFLRDTFVRYGINISLKVEEWAQFLDTRKKGNFDIARNGWVADYDDPSSYLSMWTTDSGNNDCQLGKGRHASANIYQADLNNDGTISNDEKNLTWAKSYDVLNASAAKETDAKKRFKILHNQETLLMETGAVAPVYFYTDIYMLKKKVKGFYSSPLGYKYFLYCTVE